MRRELIYSVITGGAVALFFINRQQRILARAAPTYDFVWGPEIPEIMAPGRQPVVYAIQNSLKFLGYDPGPVDGFWGPLTESAVRNLQRDQGLAVDGVMRQETYFAINRELERFNGSFTIGIRGIEPLIWPDVPAGEIPNEVNNNAM